MTSTSTFRGDNDGKPSSRVLRPPGGGSSIVFGGNYSNEAQDKQPPRKVETPIANSQIVEQPKVVSLPVAASAAAESAASANRAKNKTCGYNPITGEPYTNQRQSTSSDDKQSTSILVKQPPGGASTKLW